MPAEADYGDEEQVLASDLIPHTPSAAPPPEKDHLPSDHPTTAGGTDPVAPARPPVWEVDRFHWPRTCQKLLADEEGYLASAGEKLVAAVRDGMRVLAITGSRRGEGRCQ
ncbi:MAG: hypothetical protein K6U89_19960 [Chloroflexi bacterium]|nr:hypothetical protein [Chloroflexota bacterium]